MTAEGLALLAPTHAVWGPARLAVALYGMRYLLMACAAFAIARPTVTGGWGRPHAQGPGATFDVRRHLQRELFHSAVTVLMFGAVNAVLFGWGLVQHSLIYAKFVRYPAWWFVLSIPMMLLLHDTLFYWLHRAMHTRWLFGWMHRVHHQSVYPTAFAAYSFHWTEALAEALIVTAIIFLVPVHPIAFLIFQTISTAYNVYGHCGREFYPAGMGTHPVGRWINTSTLHAVHHATGRHHYGLYFTFWDRWLGTAGQPRG